MRLIHVITGRIGRVSESVKRGQSNAVNQTFRIKDAAVVDAGVLNQRIF